MTFTPSIQQEAAIRAIVDWFQNRAYLQQVFRLFGFAGSGKSTILAHVIAALGLTTEPGEGASANRVLFAAFTGKAALVMTRKGTPASTIHSLIYRVSEATSEEIERAEKELFDLQHGLGRMGPAERVFLDPDQQVEVAPRGHPQAAVHPERSVHGPRCRSYRP